MSEQKQIMQAEQDFSDIQALKKVPAFGRYFLRRLSEKRDEFAGKVLDEDSSPEKREIWRQIYQEYKTVCEMVTRDENNAVKILKQAPPSRG